MTASTDAAAPTSGAEAYRTTLLTALGDRDPAVVQGETPAELRRLVEEAGPHLRERPAPNEWSVLELVGHIADAELVVGTRYRFIVAHERPAITPYDQDLWAMNLHHNDADPEELLGPFEAMRRANLALWQRMPLEARQRIGIHAERGPESYDMTFRLLAGHDLVHTAQAWQTLETVRAAAAGAGATARETN